VADSIGGGGDAAYHHWKEGLTDETNPSATFPQT